MTIGAIAASQLAELQQRAQGGTRDDQAREAAKQFEALLVRQLWQIMRKTAGDAMAGGSGPGSGMYGHMMDEAMASHLTEAGGLGLAPQLERAFGVRPQAEAPPAPVDFDAPRPERKPLVLGPATGQRLPGATSRLQRTAQQMLTPTSAPRWGRDGRLTRTELASDFQTDAPGGIARFNVGDAAGFEGRYKCNLFAFEMVRRAGFQVPLMPRTRGWGYPHPDAVTADAIDGRLQRDWGRVATGESAEEIDAAIRQGERAFLLTGAGRDGHAGHMAVIERVHSISYDEQGRVEQIVFDGWEARVGGARHLERRTWNRYGHRGGHDVRGGLARIELIELLAPPDGQPQELPLSSRVGASVHDSEITDETATEGTVAALTNSPQGSSGIDR